MLSPDGPPEATDPLGIFYITLTCVWTLLLIGGMVFLWSHRQMPMLKIRGLPLSFAAVFLLHIYWIAVQTGYFYGYLMPDGVEFWIMGIWLPFGIALFHASNSRFLHIAGGQRRFVQQCAAGSAPVKRRPVSRRFARLDYTRKMILLVSTGMVVQLFLTIIIYFVSRKFHASFGAAGTEVTGTPKEQATSKSRGWEWFPSVFWQFFWAWLVAPVILWRSRGIHDTLGWRVQTIACCIANLHSTPMWLIALYVPAMGPVNRYFIPPQWIAVSIMIIEFFTILLPCWQALRHQSLQQETLDTIAVWESQNRTGAGRSLGSATTKVAKSSTSWLSLPSLERGANSVSTASARSILNMEALEYALERNPKPLQKFSALQDFSGENIAFLMAVAKWKEVSPSRQPKRGSMSITTDASPEATLRERFNSALRIYVDFISPLDADFPVNLSFQNFNKLEAIFESPTRTIYGEKGWVDPVAPFGNAEWLSSTNSRGSSSGESQKPVVSPRTPQRDSDEARSVRAQYWGEVPQGFDENVFDEAELSIKYLVLTNTWPKFVKGKRSLESLDLDLSPPESPASVLDKVVSKCQVAITGFRARL